MKVIPLVLQTSDTLCMCLRIVRADGVVLGFTTLDRPLEIDGLTYAPGLNVSSLSSSASLAVDNMELTLLGGDDQEAADLIAGRWNNSFFEVFETDYTAVPDSSGTPINVIKRGYSGEVQFSRGKYVIEFRGLAQALQQTQGVVTQKLCRARLGDSKCRVDLEDWTVVGTAEDVGSRRVFWDSARTEEDGWFQEGMLTFTSGANVGLSQKVKLYEITTNGAGFELSLPMPFDIEPGDEYSVYAGCRNRLQEDCRDKFDNVLNFQAEPHLPGFDALSRSAKAKEQPATIPDVPPLGNEYGSAGGD